MNWGKAPLPVAILLLCLAGVLRIREQGGEGDGFLLAGAGLILAGIWASLEVMSRVVNERHPDEPDKAFWEKMLDRREAGKRMSEHPIVDALHQQDEAIDELGKEIVEEEVQKERAEENE